MSVNDQSKIEKLAIYYILTRREKRAAQQRRRDLERRCTEDGSELCRFTDTHFDGWCDDCKEAHRQNQEFRRLGSKASAILRRMEKIIDEKGNLR